MSVICTSPEIGCLALTSGNQIIIASETTNKAGCTDNEVQLHSLSFNDSPVVCMSFSSLGKLLAVCTDDKTLRLWKVENGWSLKAEKSLPKRATVLTFTNNDQSILIADKAGDVHQYHVTNLSLPGTPLLGHLSMLLDMVLLPSNSHVITCDRDEKIRVSNYPNTYNIETFCLGHTEFVSKLCLCKEWPHLLLSASGDGTVKCWDWKNGRLLDTVVCSRSVNNDVPEAVTGLCCSNQGSPSLVVASLERSPVLLVFVLSSVGKLTECSESTINLATPPFNLAFDLLDRLWACLPHQPEPLVCYCRHGNKLSRLKAADNPVLDKLNKWEHFKFMGTRDWDILRKKDFDNMSAYFARKTERIKEQEAKKETTVVTSTAKSKKMTTISSSQDELHLDKQETKTDQQTCSSDSGTIELLASTESMPEAKRIKTSIVDKI